MKKQIYLLLISLAFGSFVFAQTHVIDPSQKILEGTTIGSLSKTNDVLAYFGPLTYAFECPDTYGDDEYGVRFTSVSDNVTLDSAAFAFNSQLGDPDINVNVYDVDAGLPDALLGTLVVAFADITTPPAFTTIDLTSLGLSFNTGDEFFITYSVVGGIYGTTQMDIISDDASTAEDRSVENYAGFWGTMTDDWGDNYEFVIAAFLNNPNITCATANTVYPGTYTAPAPTGGGAANICYTGATDAVWYKYTPPSDGEITIESITTGEDTRLSLYDGDCATLNCFANDDDSGDGYLSLLENIAVTGGTTYYIEWDDRWSPGDCEWTLSFASCSPPTAQTVVNFTLNGADLGWTSVDSFFDIYIVPTGDPAPDFSATPTVDDNAGTSYTWTGGASATTYDWYVRTDCGQDNIDVSDWVGPSTFSTACGPNTTFPMMEDFEGTFLPDCWSKIVTAPNDITQDAAQDHTTGTGFSARFSSYTSGSDYNQYLFTQSQTIDAGFTKLSFWHRKYNTSAELLEWGISTSTNPGTFTWAPVTLSNTDWQETTVDLAAYIGQTVYIGFHYYGSYAYYVYLDDVSIDAYPTDVMDWNNLQWPDMATIDASQNETVYSQGYEPGVTDADPTLPGTGVNCWIGYNTINDDPATWTNWVVATYNNDVGNNDEFMANLGADQGLTAGTYYYASRWQLNGGPFTYGGYNAGGGNFWDGSTNVSGVLTVNPIANDDCSGAIALTVDCICTPITSSNVGASDSGEVPGCANYLGGDVWFSAVVPASGYLVVETFVNGGFTDGGMAAWTGSCAGLTLYECDDDDGEGLMPLLEINDLGLAGQTLYFNVWEYGNNSFGAFDICAHTSPLDAMWTGALSNDWHDAGNWDTDCYPSERTNVNIPAGLSTYPTIGVAASCNTIHIASTVSGDASLLDGGFLTVGGDVTVDRFIGADAYHGFSSSVGGEVAGIFHLPGSTGLDVYLYSNNEATYDYTEIVPDVTPLNTYEGYMVWLDGVNATPPVSGWTFTETGDLNTGAFGGTDNIYNTVGDLTTGWNLLGNPYTSALDWQSAYTASGANVDATVYVNNPALGQWATWSQGGGGNNGGSQYIAMGQGFFVHATAIGAGTFTVDNTDRVHNNTPFLKSEISNKVTLQVEGNEYTDETAILFSDGATVDFDADFDAFKIMSDHPGVPSLYSIGTTNYAVNALPETNWVQLGFHAAVSGEYTISAIEVNDIGDVVLEDTFTGEMTDLKSDSYTFTYSDGDAATRFIVHFTPLGLDDNMGEATNIYSHNKTIYINVPENTNGNTVVYDMMGKEVANTAISGTFNTITLEKSAYYVVKVLSNENIITQKVFIK